jgi:hypothetical protein
MEKHLLTRNVKLIDIGNSKRIRLPNYPVHPVYKKTPLLKRNGVLV